MSTATTGTVANHLIAYFPSDAIHARNYQVSEIPADQLTHIIYAFANVTTGGECALVSAQDDKVNFPQLVQLKQQHPKLLTLISIGGASHSANFSHAAATNRSAAHAGAILCAVHEEKWVRRDRYRLGVSRFRGQSKTTRRFSRSSDICSTPKVPPPVGVLIN